MLETLKLQFLEPSDEFTPIPFWFWNDELSREEIVRQIHDFHAKGVSGFVLHPRMGLPQSQPYLSDEFMDFVEAAVKEAAQLGMSVILYDEGMYPSGAANGLVVKRNTEFASRGLRMAEYPCTGQAPVEIKLTLSPGDRIISVQAVRKKSEKEIEPGESFLILDSSEDGVRFTPPREGQWSVLVFIDTYSKGTIRGIHFGQDDGEPDAPMAADLLNPEAIQTFISLTHEKYYEKLKPYFGSTVIAMFTDEPDLLGRRHVKGLKPWTTDFLNEFLEGGNQPEDLPVLWFDAGEETGRIRSLYENSVYSRLTKTYYKQLYEWCENHGIALTGHPAASDDIGLLTYFHIPGQDVVWRFIAPEDDKSLTEPHSTLGKCSADSARHRGRRRNLNECFGVCGKESSWALKADEMKWYLDWLFIRGVNLISPHAFYYSIRDERRDERPPDVGPNNIWWPEYHRFSKYIKRMSWLMTDSLNITDVAVLAQESRLPWKSVKPFYENQVEFNYLEEEILRTTCELQDGTIRIAGQKYRAVLVENGSLFSPETWNVLREFVRQGGIVIEVDDNETGTISNEEIGQRRVGAVKEIPELLEGLLGKDPRLVPSSDSIRISHVTKAGIHFYVVVNEGEDAYEGELQINVCGKTEMWHPWTGAVENVPVSRKKDGAEISFQIQRRECLLIVVDPQQEAVPVSEPSFELVDTIDLSDGWRLQEGNEVQTLSSWTEWEGMEHFSGTIIYERSFRLEQAGAYSKILLNLGEAHELVRLWVNCKEAGVQMWSPYVFSIEDELLSGENVFRISVTNSLANRYDQKSLPSGLIGPVQLLCYN
ncbi:hypothetical protein M5X11_24750 [Paenibacillus alginolyticus]|uniref:Alpha-L-rhamnosidase n=1 Tax=Paenibacillus alginolyticus TaxID=59839 RepID=A0ABT4G8H2_9BACL|nr:hypothetical protein [Paenibacillus alginolyticus]MCY9692482.1 hypothetical protein [Paenibacillus alginolyticus]MEC0144274.1 glycosyl hydrolase [Paenibacillus alginolyticus]